MVDSGMDPSAVAAVVADLARRPAPLRIRGTIQPYAWGGTHFIRDLVGLAPSPRQPAAELWLGAHPTAPATVRIDDRDIPLDRLIRASPPTLLGPGVSARFGGHLPYLLKVLDVARMLSIQAHPTPAQAVEGFDREARLAIPLDAPNRTYRDPRHKPEMQVALTEFWMLHGFRPLDATLAALEGAPELEALAALLRTAAGSTASADGLRRAYETLMTLPQNAVDAVLAPVAAWLVPRYRGGQLDHSTHEFWAARAFEQFPLPGGHLDRGIGSVFLMNLVRLAPGEATFIGPGVLHAYLEGVAVEIMASSDNVLRGGLTPKHVDVGDLLRIVTAQDGTPTFVEPTRVSTTELLYRPPVAEFQLSRVSVSAERPHYAGPVHGADTLVVVEGAGRVRVAERFESVERGTCILVPNGMVYAVETATELTVFKAAVPASGA